MAYTNIDDPSAYFTTTLWTGAGGSPRAITNDANSGNFQPDFVWTKGRNEAYEHQLYDSSRGAGTTKGLTSNGSTAEGSLSATYGYLSSFDSNGFTGTAGTSGQNAYFDTNAKTYVAWQWKANGGTTSSNTDGSLTSTVQANQDAGFSIQTFTGASSGNSNWGHGLGVTPDVFIIKRRDGNGSWWGHWKGTARTAGSGNNWEYMGLNQTVAATSLSTFKADSTTITTSDDFVAPSASYLCYAFAEKQGYSKFGSYVGNGNSDGTFVYTGFKPAWVMTKEVNAAGAWVMYDNKRSTTSNPQDKYFSANTADEEATFTQYDFVSNGFKFRTSGSENSSGNKHIYMAFAENPFVTSTGIPTTAR